MSRDVITPWRAEAPSKVATSMTWRQASLSVFGLGVDLPVLFILLAVVTLPNDLFGMEDAPNKVTIPLPEGRSMIFRAVYLGIDGEQMFNSRRVKLGSREPSPNYKQRLTETLISGGFVGKRRGRLDWLYYLSETEVQENQWNAVMRWMDKTNQETTRPSVDSTLPQTGVTVAEIYEFIEVLNTWMLTHVRHTLPRYRGALAFCRLPTEAEWAFAARGGIEVIESNPDVFDRPHPYGEDLGDHEWYRNTSGNRVRECGSRNIKPNPLGLLDMLGNVEELTMSLFGPQYQQGRFGYFVIRGGNFSTSANDLSAALRTEACSHNTNGEVVRSPKVGVRLALSTRISSVHATPSELDAAFDAYLTGLGLTRPGPVGTSSPAAQAGQDRLYLLEEELKRLRSENQRFASEIAKLEQVQQSEQERVLTAKRARQDLLMRLSRKDQEIADLKRRVALFEHEIGKNVGRVRQVEKRYLEALMRQASANAYIGWRTLTQLKLLPDESRTDELYKKRWKEASQMVEDYRVLVVQIAEETMADLFPQVKADLAHWLRAREQWGAIGRQRKALDLLERHISDARAGRLDRPEDLVRSFPDEPELH